MRTTVEQFNGQRAIVRFHPTLEIEPKILGRLRTNQLPEQYLLTVVSWVEDALEMRGYPECSVLEFEGMTNSGGYLFRVEQAIGMGG